MQCIKYVEENNVIYKIQYRLVDSKTCLRYKTIEIDNKTKVIDVSIIVRHENKFILWTGNGSNGKSTIPYYMNMSLCMTNKAKEFQNEANEILKQQYNIIYKDNDSVFLNKNDTIYIFRSIMFRYVVGK